MIYKRLIQSLLLFVLASTAHAGWDDFLDIFTDQSAKLTESTALENKDIVAGLKEALIKGSKSAVSTLGKPNGFLSHPKLKIPMPEKLQAVESGLRKLGQDELADEFVVSLNRAAEKAVPKAMDIFGNTIRSMSIEDAYAVLKGSDTAATDYLREHSGAELQQAFLPIVKQATASVGVTDKYKNLIDKLGVMANFIDVESLDIDQYVTGKAMDGLFTLVASEEKQIRENPAARTSEILKKVFSAN